MKLSIKSDLCGEMQFEMPEDKAQQIIGQACMFSSEFKCESDLYEPAVEKPKKAASRVENLFGDYKKRIPISVVVPAAKKQIEGYKGFLLIRCETCGELRGYYAKTPNIYYFCKACNSKTKLQYLIPAYMYCKCGSNFKYLTNYPYDELTYNCLDCKTPVEMHLNQMGNAYTTVNFMGR